MDTGRWTQREPHTAAAAELSHSSQFSLTLSQPQQLMTSPISSQSPPPAMWRISQRLLVLATASSIRSARLAQHR